MENEPQQNQTSTPVVTTTSPTFSSGRSLLRQALTFTWDNFWVLLLVTGIGGVVTLPSIILALVLESRLDTSLVVQYGLAILVTVLSLVGSIITIALTTRTTMHAGEWRLRAIIGSLGTLWWPLSVTLFFAYGVMMAGFLFFIVPGIAFTVFLTPVMWVVAVEGLFGKAALTRTISLVQGHWWVVCWRLVFLLLVFLLVLLLGGVAFIMLAPAAFFLYMINPTLAFVVSAAAGLLLYLVSVTLATFVAMRYSLLMYQELAARHTTETKPSTWSTWPLTIGLVLGTIIGVLYILALPHLTLEDMRANSDEATPWDASFESMLDL